MVDEVHEVVFVDGIHLGRKAVVLIAQSRDFILGWYVARSENSRAWEALMNRSSPVEWCNRFVSFGVGYALSWSGGSSCWVGCGVSRDLVRMSRLR